MVPSHTRHSGQKCEPLKEVKYTQKYPNKKYDIKSEKGFLVVDVPGPESGRSGRKSGVQVRQVGRSVLRKIPLIKFLLNSGYPSSCFLSRSDFYKRFVETIRFDPRHPGCHLFWVRDGGLSNFRPPPLAP